MPCKNQYQLLTLVFTKFSINQPINGFLVCNFGDQDVSSLWISCTSPLWSIYWYLRIRCFLVYPYLFYHLLFQTVIISIFERLSSVHVPKVFYFLLGHNKPRPILAASFHLQQIPFKAVCNKCQMAMGSPCLLPCLLWIILYCGNIFGR